MRLKLKNTPEQVELIKAMGSKDPAVAREASEAFAAFLGPVVRQVLMQANTSSAISPTPRMTRMTILVIHWTFIIMKVLTWFKFGVKILLVVFPPPITLAWKR